MKSGASYLLSIVAAIVPLTIALVVTWALYVYAGIGTPRNFYDLLRSTENLQDTTRYSRVNSGRRTREAYFPRWQGTPENPLNLLIVGTSPTQHAVLPEQADALERDLNINVYNVARTNVQSFRYFDEIRILSTLTDIDIIVLEYSLGFSSDHRIAYKYKMELWKRQVYDDEIFDSIRAVRNVWDNGNVGPREDVADWYAQTYNEIRENWLDVVANPDKPRTRYRSPGTYSSAKVRNLKRRGYIDLDSVDIDIIRTNFVTYTILRRIHEFCLDNQIGLVIYVPAMSAEVTRDPEGRPLLTAQYRYSRATLQYAASLYGIKVFDYYERENDIVNFLDAVHLHRASAIEFSKVFFDDLKTFFVSDEKDYSYVKRR